MRLLLSGMGQSYSLENDTTEALAAGSFLSFVPLAERHVRPLACPLVDGNIIWFLGRLGYLE